MSLDQNLLIHQSGQFRSQEIESFRNVFENIIEKLSGKFPDINNNNNNSNEDEKNSERITWQFPVSAGIVPGIGDPTLSIPNRWLREMFSYNIPGGKLIRGLSLVINYKILKYGYGAKQLPEDDEGLFQARVLGWCMEMFQAYFLILDDIMDNSVTRRGQPCWYRNDHVGLIACNDSTLIQSSIFHLLYRVLRHHPNYLRIVHLINEGFRITGYGQCLDILTESQAKLTNGQELHDLSGYTLERYRTIVKYKTSFYTFVMSTRIAFYLANRTDPLKHQTIETVMTKIGELFQIQDDYLDCYGDPAVTGKIGTDIRDAKCSWLVVQALAKNDSDNNSKQILSQHYGMDSDRSEQIVKELYARLNLQQVFRDYETRKMKQIVEEIELLRTSHKTDKFPVEIFYEPLSNLFQRNK